jgi:hypothetical protein
VVVVRFAVNDNSIMYGRGGFGWDFEGFEMDSAVWTPESALAFTFARLTWVSGNIDSTNFYDRFQVTGYGMDPSAFLVTSADICVFYGHVTSWEDGDTINITPNAFVAMEFEIPDRGTFVPNWGGDATIAALDCPFYCCSGRVGDANGLGGDEPSLGDISVIIDVLFIGGDPVVIACLAEADIDQSGDIDPVRGNITIGDITVLVDYLFITGPSLGLPDCQKTW